VNDAGTIAVIETETGMGAPDSRQCQVYTSTPGDPLLRLEVAERCPNQAEALLWFTCQNGHESTEEVCRGHVRPFERQWCAACVKNGNQVPAVITFVGWL
jgi:hypothetical protein